MNPALYLLIVNLMELKSEQMSQTEMIWATETVPTI